MAVVLGNKHDAVLSFIVFLSMVCGIGLYGVGVERGNDLLYYEGYFIVRTM